MSLKKKIQALKSSLAAAAQKEVDAWEQDEEGLDEELGSGGICDRVASAMADVLYRIPDVSITDGGHEGDDHAYLLVYDDNEAYAVDIPPGVYEIGGGYSWKKRPGVEVSAEDVVIYKVDRQLI